MRGWLTKRPALVARRRIEAGAGVPGRKEVTNGQRGTLPRLGRAGSRTRTTGPAHLRRGGGLLGALAAGGRNRELRALPAGAPWRRTHGLLRLARGGRAAGPGPRQRGLPAPQR